MQILGLAFEESFNKQRELQTELPAAKKAPSGNDRKLRSGERVGLKEKEGGKKGGYRKCASEQRKGEKE